MRRRFVIVLATAAVLAGCASAPSAPKVQEVLVPTPVLCKASLPAHPAFAVDSLPVGAGIWEQMLALRAERMQRKAHVEELEAAVKACSE